MDTRFERKSILSTLRLNGEMCPIVFDGTLDSHLFSEYIRTHLKPMLSPCDILILDNSSVHTSKLVKDTLAELEIKHIYLPPYSPDFNPIELLWAFMKLALRKQKARTHEKLTTAIGNILNSIKTDTISNWFRHCGYSS